MAGMFYTLQEVIEKLGKAEAEIRGLVKEGKLREFRDGAKQLYKIEDVDAIASSAKGGGAVLNDSLEISIDETGEVSLAPEELDVLMGTGADKGQETNFKLDETGELLGEETLGGTPRSEKGDKSKGGSEILLSPAESGEAKIDTKLPGTGSSSTSSISLTSTGSQQGSDLTSGDTKISEGGDTINVLSESDTGYKISEDTSGDTKLMDKKSKALDQKGKADDAGIARLDEDINLEGAGGAGSGSGLLDLSLQADDTSLGAVLDDIYPESPSAAVEKTPLPEVSAEEPDKMLEGSEAAAVGVPEEVMPQETSAAMPAGAVMTFEAPADSTSNVFGAILFVPLIVLIYSAIAVISGYKPILNMPIVSSVGPIIWYVAAGLCAVTILGVLIGTFAGAPKKPKEPKPMKVKPVKEKKAKKGEQPKA